MRSRQNQDIVVTAGHCCSNSTDLQVFTGLSSEGKYTVRVPAKTVKVHERYKRGASGWANDICILGLRWPLPFDKSWGDQSSWPPLLFSTSFDFALSLPEGDDVVLEAGSRVTALGFKAHGGGLKADALLETGLVLTMIEDIINRQWGREETGHGVAIDSDEGIYAYKLGTLPDLVSMDQKT